MALHTELPIYRTGVQLLALAIQAQEQMPRGVKRSLGDKIAQHCVDMLDLMALANATKAHERARHIQALLTHLKEADAACRRWRTLDSASQHPATDPTKRSTRGQGGVRRRQP